jgi:hypothetical protein
MASAKDTLEAAAHAAAAKRLAVLRSQARRRPWNGRGIPARPERMFGLTEPGRPTSVMLSFDQGTHASGWWRNSTYDSCFHLSIAHLGDDGRTLESPSDTEVRAWARAAFPQHYAWTWTERPLDLGAAVQSTERCGVERLPHVAHVRLFTDRAGIPILPRGEVYDLVPYLDGTSPEKVFR